MQPSSFNAYVLFCYVLPPLFEPVAVVTPLHRLADPSKARIASNFSVAEPKTGSIPHLCGSGTSLVSHDNCFHLSLTFLNLAMDKTHFTCNMRHPLSESILVSCISQPLLRLDRDLFPSIFPWRVMQVCKDLSVSATIFPLAHVHQKLLLEALSA